MRRKDDNKRLAIYQAAMSVITRDGLPHASMSKIARHAGVSPSTLYVYFDNKNDMLNKLYLMMKEESTAAFFQDFTDDMEVQEGLAAYMKGLFYYMVANPIQFSFHEQFINSPIITSENYQRGWELYAPLLSLYEKGLRQNLVKDYPPLLLAGYMQEPILWLVRVHLEKEIEVGADVLEKAVEMTWHAIRK